MRWTTSLLRIERRLRLQRLLPGGFSHLARFARRPNRPSATPPGDGLSPQARELLQERNGPFNLRGAIVDREELERLRRADDRDQLRLVRECRDRNSVSAQVVRFLSAGTAQGPLIVSYHGLGGSDGVNPADFEAHLEILLARRKIIPLAESVSCLGTPEAGNLASITFDDAYGDYAEIAVPVLERLDLQATLFVPAGMIGKSNQWDHGIMEERRILDSEELRSLDPRRTEIGSHGYSHCRMRGLSPEALHREIDEARSILSDISGKDVRLLAYPYGQADDFDDATARAAERAGFIGACSTRFGRGSSPGERFRLCRVCVEPGDSREVVRNKFDGVYDWTAWKENVGLMLRRVGLR